MTIRSVLIATGSVLALALAGCGSSIAGSPQAALPLGAISGAQSSAPDVVESQSLGLPSDVTEAPSSGGTQLPSTGSLAMPDLSGVLDGLSGLDGQNFDPSQLGALLGALGGAEGTGGLAGLGGLTGLSPECSAVTGASITLGMLLLTPMMGKPLTQAEVDSAFASLSKFPPELRGAVDSLRQAAEGAVGKSAAEAGSLLSNPAVDSAMDQVSTYMDAHCSTQ
ncbi:MAG: hypothetical protein ABI382_07190 [Nakamurella sp.]